MVGVAFNPNNCVFLANQALNAGQFNSNVPDSANTTVHTVLWDFIAGKIYWVDAKTNIIQYEIPSVIDGNLFADIAYLGVDEGGYNFKVNATGGRGNSILTVNTLVGGTGYVDGTYDVNVSGGLGTGAVFTITVSGGVVTSASGVYGGTGYAVGDVLTLVGGNNNATITVATIAPYLYSWSLESAPSNNWNIPGATNTINVTAVPSFLVAPVAFSLLRCKITDLDGRITTAYQLLYQLD